MEARLIHLALDPQDAVHLDDALVRIVHELRDELARDASHPDAADMRSQLETLERIEARLAELREVRRADLGGDV